jgi:hypothetical protein
MDDALEHGGDSELVLSHAAVIDIKRASREAGAAGPSGEIKTDGAGMGRIAHQQVRTNIYTFSGCASAAAAVAGCDAVPRSARRLRATVTAVPAARHSGGIAGST